MIGEIECLEEQIKDQIASLNEAYRQGLPL
jgi:hypothetical protein